jgi:DNA-binding transcriptional regulator YhcF (GntR family)
MKISIDNAIHFNSEWVASKTLQEFIEHESHHGLSEKQLKDVYKKCVKAHKPAKDIQEVEPE